MYALLMSGRKDKCGLLGVFSLESHFKDITSETLSFIPHNELKSQINSSLLKLQHRGQESYGISYLTIPKTSHTPFPPPTLITRKQLGLVSPTYIASIKDNFQAAICHVRYSTSKDSKNQTLQRKIAETQPLQGNTSKHGRFTLAHNGNIPHKVQEKLIKHYRIKQLTNSDSETITRLIELFASEYDSFKDGLIKLVNTVEGVYNLLILTESQDIYAIRDRHGVRPLTLAKTTSTEYIVTSETCALPEDAKVIRDIEPGEIIKISSPYTDKIQLATIHKESTTHPPTFCSFEYIYFMRPQSTFNYHNVGDLRFRMGVFLAKKERLIPEPTTSSTSSTPNPIVIGMPNTAIPVGEGFARTLNLPYHQYIKKAKDCGRTFILPDDADRLQKLRNKFLFSKHLEGKTIYLCDDSIVRGNTMRELIHLLRTEHKVKTVHVRISSPPVRNVCHYGIDIPTKEQLIGATEPDIPSIQRSIKADSLVYLSLEDMKSLMETPTQKVCTSCFDNNYNAKLLDW